MSHHVITISRGLGSGGRDVGKLLANELGFAFYDRELLRMASDESGINEMFFARADESVRKTRLFGIAKSLFDGLNIPTDRDTDTSNEKLFQYQAKIIRKLAESEECVIVGRCANYILRDMPHVLRLYIHSPEDACIRSVMRMQGISAEEAAKMVRDTNERRAAYFHFFTGENWKDADLYDLSLDAHALGADKCVELVKAYLQHI